MRVNARRFAAVYLEAALDAPESELDSIARRFVRLVTKYRSRRLLPKILTEVERRWNERHGIEAVRVTTARVVDRRIIEERLGREIELLTSVNPSLLAGAIIERGDERIDASVRGALERLGHALRRKE